MRNISEGSGAAATSKKTEIKLTNVARASLSDELLKDYKSFLIQNGLRISHMDSREDVAMRERLKHDVASNLPPAADGQVRLTGLAKLSDFAQTAIPELAANAMLCAVNQAAYLMRRQLEQQSKKFREKGGFTERLHATRVKHRESERSVALQAEASAPKCPACGNRMHRRIARKGPRADQTF